MVLLDILLKAVVTDNGSTPGQSRWPPKTSGEKKDNACLVIPIKLFQHQSKCKIIFGTTDNGWKRVMKNFE
jgi:hypothetical protein